MKKKLLVLAAVFMLLFSFAGQAMASFDSLELIQAVSQVSGTGTNEVLTDLGSFSSTAPISGSTTYTNAINLSNFGSGATLANLEVQYFVADTTNFDKVWLSGPTTGQQSAIAHGDAITGNMYSVYYQAQTHGGNPVVQAQNPGDSSVYAMLENSGINRGGMAGFIAVGSAVANLGSGAVTLYLYYYGGNLDAAQSGLPVAMITTNADGSTTVSAIPAVPIPAAVWLLGSGLMSLVGIRRRTTAV